jgi:hypothetical protein
MIENGSYTLSHQWIQCKQSCNVLLVSNLKVCATWNIESPMLNIIAIDIKLDLPHEVYTIESIFYYLGDMCKKGA